jgi:hypothetical protein
MRQPPPSGCLNVPFLCSHDFGHAGKYQITRIPLACINTPALEFDFSFPSHSFQSIHKPQNKVKMAICMAQSRSRSFRCRYKLLPPIPPIKMASRHTENYADLVAKLRGVTNEPQKSGTKAPPISDVEIPNPAPLTRELHPLERARMRYDPKWRGIAIERTTWSYE